MRLFTTVPVISRKLKFDLALDDGLVIPAKSEVFVSIIGMHGSETYYDEPKEYRPERFLSEQSRHPFVFVPFSAGPRNCIGQRFAMADLKVIVACVLRELQLESLMPLHRVKNRMEIVLKPEHPVPMRVHRREH